MSAKYQKVVRQLAKPLQPQPTAELPRLERLPSIRAVLFDVYGTIMISASGDIGLVVERDRSHALCAAFAALGAPPPRDAVAAVAQFDAAITRRHEIARSGGVDFPEVDIREVWTDLIAEWTSCGWIPKQVLDVELLAIEYEMRVNPVWPMPGAGETLQALGRRELTLGIVSNAQFFTPLIVETLFGETLDGYGFAPHLRYYSYRHRQAKPGETMYRLAAERLASDKIEPAEVLYIGNDVRNDIRPAESVGFRTGLFAGDARSLRLRRDDAACKDVRADVVMTDVRQLLQLLG